MAQPMTNREWVASKNLEWRTGLRSVSLVAELDVDDDDLERAERLLGANLRLNTPEDMVRHDPAFFVVALTAAGGRSWSDGTFYSRVAATLNVQQDLVEQAVRVYRYGLKKLGLPTFSDVGGMKWVTPVLMHGAVPIDELGALLDLLASRRRLDPSVTGESFVEWVRANGARLQTAPKALTRFLTHGGDFAADLMNRVIDLTDGSEVALPRRIRTRLLELVADGRSRPTSVREPRPTVGLAPDGEVVLRLPCVAPEHGRDLLWKISLDGDLVEKQVSVPWQEGRHLTLGAQVVLGHPVREIVVSKPGTETIVPFVSDTDPLLVFGADGELIPVSRPIPAGVVTLMLPGTDRATFRDGTPVLGQEREVPFGWAGWSALEVELRTGQSILSHNGVRRRVTGADQARLELGELIPGLLTEDRRPVTDAVPRVVMPEGVDLARWTYTVGNSLGHVLESGVPPSDNFVVLPDHASTFVGDVIVSVRGPLGRGLTRRVAIAAGGRCLSVPERRSLRDEGGLVPAEVTVLRDSVELGRCDIGPEAAGSPIVVDGIRGFIAEPPFVAHALVIGGVPEAWSFEQHQLTTDELRQCVLRVRGLDGAQSHRLELHTADDRQSVRGGSERRGAIDFNLAGFRDTVERVGAARLVIRGRETFSAVVIRPPVLFQRLELKGHTITLEPLIKDPLEVVVYRQVAPWEPGTVLNAATGSALLPEELVDRGSMRIAVRVSDPWFSAPTRAFPQPGKDVVDVTARWDWAKEDPDLLELHAAIAGGPQLGGGNPSRPSLVRGLESLAVTSLDAAGRERVAQLLAQDTGGVLEVVPETSISSRDLVGVLVETGLVSSPAHWPSHPRLVESLLGRSALAGVLGASAALTHDQGLRALVLGHVGEREAQPLLAGEADMAAHGRFEPYFEVIPEKIKELFDLLAPVPTRLLAADTRTSASYEMWRSRRFLSTEATAAMPLINRARGVIKASRPDLWPLIEARLSHDGVIALPALSVALALVARLSAHGNASAAALAWTSRRVFTQLARHAPQLVEIDLVRADLAVLGAKR